MIIDRQELFALSKTAGFRVEMLEKVMILMDLLKAFHQHPMLRHKLALKGGTALNLFFLGLPRLSIDIDLNYVASDDRALMLQERPEIEKIIINICSQKGLTLRRHPRNMQAEK